MNTARIDRASGRVVNIEVTDDDWLAEHIDDDAYLFVSYTAAAPARIGDLWDGARFASPLPLPEVESDG